MSRSSKTLLAALLSALALLAGCGGASFNGQVYRGQGMAFQVGPVPGSWRRIEVSHALLAYRDESAEAHHCAERALQQGRRRRPAGSADAPPVPDVYRPQHRQPAHASHGRSRRDAHQVVADLDGVPKHFVVYVLKKDNCVYDFIHIAAVNPPESSTRSFEQFVKGFATLG